jgi:hypothetical protein
VSQLRSGGVLKTVAGADPAAGAEVSDAVPAGKVWRLIAVLLTLVTDANVANRRVHLTLDDGATVFFRRGSNATQAATLTQNYEFCSEAQEAAVRDLFVADPLPMIDLPAGARIRTVTVNKQAGDNYAAPVYYVEEFDAL